MPDDVRLFLRVNLYWTIWASSKSHVGISSLIQWEIPIEEWHRIHSPFYMHAAQCLVGLLVCLQLLGVGLQLATLNELDESRGRFLILLLELKLRVYIGGDHHTRSYLYNVVQEQQQQQQHIIVWWARASQNIRFQSFPPILYNPWMQNPSN